MTLKTMTIILFATALFSCSAHAGPRGSHYEPQYGEYHHKHQRHHHHKRKCRKHDHRYRYHYRGAAHTPAHVIPGLELGLRYGFPAGETIIVYRSPYGY